MTEPLDNSEIARLREIFDEPDGFPADADARWTRRLMATIDELSKANDNLRDVLRSTLTGVLMETRVMATFHRLNRHPRDYIPKAGEIESLARNLDQADTPIEYREALIELAGLCVDEVQQVEMSRTESDDD